MEQVEALCNDKHKDDLARLQSPAWRQCASRERDIGALSGNRPGRFTALQDCDETVRHVPIGGGLNLVRQCKDAESVISGSRAVRKR